MPSRRRAVDPGHHGLRRGHAGAAGRPGRTSGRSRRPRGGLTCRPSWWPRTSSGARPPPPRPPTPWHAARPPLGWSARRLPLADGGEGLLDALGSLGGERRTVEVEGPLGRPVAAEWLLVGNLAVVEMAQASGLVLAGGAAGNDPLGATTRGTGQLIVAAARARRPPPAGRTGCRRSVRRDGGGGTGRARPPPTAGGARWPPSRRRGASGGWPWSGPATSTSASSRPPPGSAPRRAPTRPRWSSSAPGSRTWPVATSDRYGVDVRAVAGSGAAGGLGGAIAALGGRLRSGYDVVTELLGFERRPGLQPGRGDRRGGLRRHLAAGQGGRLGAGRRLGGRPAGAGGGRPGVAGGRLGRRRTGGHRGVADRPVRPRAGHGGHGRMHRAGGGRGARPPLGPSGTGGASSGC